MFVYRLTKCPNFTLASVPFDVMRNKMLNVPAMKLVGYSPTALDEDKKLFFDTIKLIGWNGSKGGELMCYAVPYPHTFNVGFLLQNGTNPAVFVGYPFPLDYLNEEADDRTDSMEKARTIAAMQGKDTEPYGSAAPISHADWRRSYKGNMWTTIEGTNCVVLPEGSGFRALLRGGGTNTITSKVFPTEAEVIAYVMNNYRNLIKPWLMGRMNAVASADLFIEDDTDD
jgi:hypothetical protein